MIKLIILSLVGRDKIKNPNALFRLVKSYLILYMLALPAGKIMAQASDKSFDKMTYDKSEYVFQPHEEPIVPVASMSAILPAKIEFLPMEKE